MSTVWDVKGNDRLLNAFAKFLLEGNKAHLTLMDWGYEEDVAAAKKLIKEHGIEENVTWMLPVSKPTLIKLINEADVVFDQFLFGSTGTLGLEAMSCGTPVCMHLGEYHNRFYGEQAPVAEARTEEQIYHQMHKLKDPEYRTLMGKISRGQAQVLCQPVQNR